MPKTYPEEKKDLSVLINERYTLKNSAKNLAGLNDEDLQKDIESKLQENTEALEEILDFDGNDVEKEIYNIDLMIDNDPLKNTFENITTMESSVKTFNQELKKNIPEDVQAQIRYGIDRFFKSDGKKEDFEDFSEYFKPKKQ